MKVVIIGGIAAGMSAAAKLRRVDPSAEVIVYEKSKIVSFGACGLPYYVGNFFSDSNEMIARTPEKLQEAGIHVNMEHEVLQVIPESKCIKVKDLKTNEVYETNYDKLLIASGAKAILPPIKNRHLKNVYTLKSMEDGIALKEKMMDSNIRKVAIIGGGFIGVEAVEAARVYGKEVHLFQIEERVLGETFDQEITDLLEAELRSHNVELHLKSMVKALEGEGKVEAVITEDKKIEADLVIIAAGVRPATSFMEGTNIHMLNNGAIVVNEKGETSIQDIYAAGDCATVSHRLKKEPAYIPLATYANKCGRIVGENLGGMDSAFQGALGSSCLKVMDFEAVRTGLSEKEAEEMGINYKTVFVKDMNQTSYYPGQKPIYIKLVYNAETKVLLGGQVVGKKDAVQRGNVLAVAIYAGLTTNELGMMDLCYAPPFSRTWDVVNVAGNVAK